MMVLWDILPMYHVTRYDRLFDFIITSEFSLRWVCNVFTHSSLFFFFIQSLDFSQTISFLPFPFFIPFFVPSLLYLHSFPFFLHLFIPSSLPSFLFFLLSSSSILPSLPSCFLPFPTTRTGIGHQGCLSLQWRKVSGAAVQTLEYIGLGVPLLMLTHVQTHPLESGEWGPGVSLSQCTL